MIRLLVLLLSCLVTFSKGSTSTVSPIDDDVWLSLSRSIDKLRESLDRNVDCGSRNADDRLNRLEAKVRQLESSQKPTGVFFNALATKTVSCYNCLIDFDEISADSHDAFDGQSFTTPIAGYYMLQFHAVTERGVDPQLELLVNGVDVAHLYDRDIAGRDERYAMLSQSVVRRLRRGDRVSVRLHSGALKGGGQATYTSFVGLKLGNDDEGEDGAQNEI